MKTEGMCNYYLLHNLHAPAARVREGWYFAPKTGRNNKREHRHAPKHTHVIVILHPITTRSKTLIPPLRATISTNFIFLFQCHFFPCPACVPIRLHGRHLTTTPTCHGTHYIKFAKFVRKSSFVDEIAQSWMINKYTHIGASYFADNAIVSTSMGTSIWQCCKIKNYLT